MLRILALPLSGSATIPGKGGQYMDTKNLYHTLTEQLLHLLSVTDLYDYDRNKERIRIVLFPVKDNPALLDTLPHCLFDSTDYAGVFSLELFRDGMFHIGSYITQEHLTLWKKTTDDLFRLVTGST